MTDKKGEEPAYPNITQDMPVDGSPGMSLRDWFAGVALQGLLSLYDYDFEEAAKDAYFYAEKMIEERGK